jgi:hypothetical protein
MWAAEWPLLGFSGSESAEPVILRCGSDSTYGESEARDDCDSNVWTQAPANLFRAGQQLVDIAAEPGADAAWVTLRSSDGRAHLARIVASEQPGQQTIQIGEEDLLGHGYGLSEDGNLGNATVISCPASNDCWLATDQGWLYHLTVPGSTLPEDTDPNFQGVITNRPPDSGIPQLIADVAPPDDSLANQQPPLPPPAPTVQTPTTLTRKPLVTDLSSHVVHRYILELSFKLTVKARVQLLASHKRRRVAQTALKTLKAGKHTLTLRLNPLSWPNKLDLKATPLEALPTVESKGSSGTTVAPPVKEDTVST